MPIVLKDISSEAEDVSNESFQTQIIKWLTSENQKLSGKYLYDDLGSQFFRQIMQLKEYYLYRSELEIIERYKDQIVNLISDQDYNIVEFGAGDGKKTIKLLMEAINQNKKITYMPIDISRGSNQFLAEVLMKESSKINAIIYTADYFKALRHINLNTTKKNLVLLLGSTIGGQSRIQARELLKKMHEKMKKGDLLMMGVDLKKDYNILTQAYDDKLGISSRFNLNILRRINKQLGADLVLDNFFRYCYYDHKQGNVKVYIVSKTEQTVHFKNGQTIKFGQFQSLFLQESNKFTLKQLTQLAEEVGFTIVRNFFDEKNYFVDTIWQK